MFLSKELSFVDHKHKALRYQPSFDLRKNVAKVIAYHSLTAVQKGVTLDIFVSHETPNYFHGNISCFLVMLSQLLKHGIDLLDQGEISIRIYHDTLHKSNSCETELSITITISNSSKQNNFAEFKQFPCLSDSTDKKIHLNTYLSLHRINHLCEYFDGNFSVKKLDDQKIQFLVTFVLQQGHPVLMFHSV